jgi:hypothetical protein
LSSRVLVRIGWIDLIRVMDPAPQVLPRLRHRAGAVSIGASVFGDGPAHRLSTGQRVAGAQGQGLGQLIAHLLPRRANLTGHRLGRPSGRRLEVGGRCAAGGRETVDRVEVHLSDLG